MGKLYTVEFENEDFILINKIAEVDFHTDEGLLAKLRQDLGEIHGVHRIDKHTTGLIIFARNKGIQQKLSELFRERAIEKIYIAVSSSKPKKKMGQIIGDLKKSRGGSYILTKEHKNPSKTFFFSFLHPSSHKRVFIVRPVTGKTHQIRVVLNSLGAAILGDCRYAKKSDARMYLHAYKIAFKLNDKVFSYSIRPELDEVFTQELFDLIEIKLNDDLVGNVLKNKKD